MVIYNPEKKVLFIPEKDDYILFDPDEVYERGYAQGYEKGRAKAEEECEEKHNFHNKYFTIESRADGSLTIPGKVSHYRKNDGEWIANSQTTLIQVVTGDKVEMKGLNDSCEALFTGATMPDEYICYGNIMSLLHNDDFQDKYRIAPEGSSVIGQFMHAFDGNTGLTDVSNLVLQATVLTRYCYTFMFGGCTALTTAPELPATTLEAGCYSYMFQGCTNLITAPELPAETLAQSCYAYMFYDCTSLTTAPELPATTLATACYRDMFNGCTSLTTAPVLSATTLASNCYYNMFHGCTSLTTAPELPATTLAQYCYHSMFSGCTSLATAPELPATSLVQSCYDEMFRGCSRLNYIKCLATDISANNCTLRWVDGVAANGTFTKASGMTSWTAGQNGIPNNWTIIDA